MSFNRRGGPDRRPDRPQRREGGDRPYQPRGGYPPRDRPPHREGGGDRPRPQRGGDRPFTPRPRFDRGPDEGAMSIRLDPRRVSTLKHLAGESGMRPGDLVRHWVEERIDAARVGEGGVSLEDRIAALEARIAAVETTVGGAAAEPATEPEPAPSTGDRPRAAEGEAKPMQAEAESEEAAPARRRRRVSAAPSERVTLHDEMIAVIGERGPMAAGELAAAITERGRYAPPRSGKPLDAAMVSQRVSNPAYRSRFERKEGRIGLAEGGGA